MLRKHTQAHIRLTDRQTEIDRIYLELILLIPSNDFVRLKRFIFYLTSPSIPSPNIIHISPFPCSISRSVLFVFFFFFRRPVSSIFHLFISIKRICYHISAVHIFRIPETHKQRPISCRHYFCVEFFFFISMLVQYKCKASENQ